MTDSEIPPAACSLLDEQHVLAALKAEKGNAARLKSWSAKTFTKRDENLTSVVVSVDVNYVHNECEENTSFVVKINPCLEENEFDSFTHQIFVKESNFLKELGPELSSVVEAMGQRPLVFPACFHAQTEEGRELIIMEDLRRRGFKTRSRFIGMDVVHSSLVVRELARIHAASSLLQSRVPGKKLADKHEFLKTDWATSTGEQRATFQKMFADCMTYAAAVLEKVGNYEQVIEWMSREKASCMDVMEAQVSKEYPFEVLCHGDCWNNNLMFRYEGEVPVEVAVLDLQMVRMASPGTDLSNFFYVSLEGSVRKQNLETFLREYHTSFTNTVAAAGVPMPFSLEELKREYLKRIRYGMYFAIMDIPVVLTDASDIPPGNDFVEKWRQKAVQTLPSNPSFGPRFLSVFDDMISEKIVPS